MPVAQKRILVVDDEPGLLFSLSAYLQDANFEVVGTTTGEEALTLLENDTFDAVIIDVRLPGKDGNAVIHQAKQTGCKATFIIHTGSTDYVVPASLRQLGLIQEDVFYKPLTNLENFCTTLRKRLKLQ